MSKLGTEEAEQIIRQYSDMIYRIAVHNLGSRRGGYFAGRVYFSADEMPQAARSRTPEGMADSRYNQQMQQSSQACVAQAARITGGLYSLRSS